MAMGNQQIYIFFGNLGKRTNPDIWNAAPSKYAAALRKTFNAHQNQGYEIFRTKGIFGCRRENNSEHTVHFFYRLMIKCKKLAARKRFGALISLYCFLKENSFLYGWMECYENLWTVAFQETYLASFLFTLKTAVYTLRVVTKKVKHSEPTSDYHRVHFFHF